MKSILLTFDTEEFDLPKEYNQDIEEEEMYSLSDKGLSNIIALLNKHNIKATFFTTTNFAKRFPKRIQQLSETHEVASHGYSHSHKINLENIKQAKEEKEKIIGKSIKGFRAPRWSIKDINIVEQAGFKYDASTHPILLPGRYNHLHQKTYIHKINNLTEIPQSTLPLNLSLFWLAFKNLPLNYAKTFTKINFLKSNYTMLIFHPWEFSNLKNINIPNYIKKQHSQKLLNKLNNYIKFCKNNGYKFQRVDKFLRY